ncbi:ribonuclease D [Tanticharoenia sakaeratensis]|uniref:Ribonuclease D n=1 Tax=Tanticharoenia sakaeratensis NBRC 103193 TaxID=1231623 RepID=A0A0D6MM52_9PROT|nr:ribonuclease D [Tanticharoenia sakaeratensis]GAN54510.1 ribonuclease D [Tanticharoenia sakaeratensis NBRC 103193]GBQ23820.1 ribonuclease D [Tanticharoenia sakaeratensis NBRC 103193]
MPKSAPSASPIFPEPQIITTTEALAALCAKLVHEPFVTVDTEFVRERTYYPELCLVQLGGTDDVAVVDALAPGLDLSPLATLLDAPECVKVLHAARQDLEIFLHLFGRLPVALFDTQVAAMVAGYGDQVGYDNLVGAITGVAIDKAHRFSDWSARPLSAAQIAYAAADVTHLRLVYVALRDELARAGRLDWADAEQAVLRDTTLYRPDPSTLWERLRPRVNNRRVLGVLREIVAWREREAQTLDLPRQRLIRDESLLEISANQPATAEALARVRGLTRGFAEGRSGQGLLGAIRIAKALPEDDLPRAPRRHEGAKPSSAMVALLKVLLAAQCEMHKVAPKLVASSDDLDKLALGETDIAPMQGWRRSVFGDEAQALLRGELALGAGPRGIRLIRTTSSDA